MLTDDEDVDESGDDRTVSKPENDTSQSTEAIMQASETTESGQYDDESSQKNSAFANIIPIQNLQNGWNVISGAISTGFVKMKEKTAEAYNSESVKSIRQVAATGINQAADVVLPAVEITKSNISAAVDYTKERATLIAANSEPAFRAVSITNIRIVLFELHI